MMHMNRQTMQIAYGCLLQAMQRLACRAQKEKDGNVPGLKQLQNAKANANGLPLLGGMCRDAVPALQSGAPVANGPAYIVWAAGLLAGAENEKTPQTEQSSEAWSSEPLQTIFTHMNGEHLHQTHPLCPQDGILRMPLPEAENHPAAEQYRDLCSRYQSCLETLPLTEDHLNAWLMKLEEIASLVPAFPGQKDLGDISLFDYAKIMAAVGTCISEYLQENQTTDYHSILFENTEAFFSTDAFLLYSADFSGIQKFIYLVSSEGALRTLRSHSFFLELLMEHYVDELLSGCGLSRINLLYSGGGHCYLLVPNTRRVKQFLSACSERFNTWLQEQFGVKLYLADAFTPCSANDLIDFPAENEPYRAMFHRVSSQISRRKMQRYTAAQLKKMNRSTTDASGRECRICGRSDHLKEDRCEWCDLFYRMSRDVQDKEAFLFTEQENCDFRLPSASGSIGVCAVTREQAKRRMQTGEKIRKVYWKNDGDASIPNGVRLYVGDYAKSNDFEMIADESQGVPRIAVCRMDVDDLGSAFVSGFEKPHAKTKEEQHRYVNIARTAAFSRQLSLFFKLYINGILSGQQSGKNALNTAIVYSGGDDVFLIGAWNDVIEAAVRVRKAFRTFTGNALSISCGIGLFRKKYPLRLAAACTAQLEEEAKSLPEKNGVALFEANSGSCYSWEVFLRNVLDEKLNELNRFFSHSDTEVGTAFLYHLLKLLRQAQTEKINLARYAYLLSRMEPLRSAPNWNRYRQFSDRMYSWALDAQQRRQLITAIEIYFYLNRT